MSLAFTDVLDVEWIKNHLYYFKALKPDWTDYHWSRCVPRRPMFRYCSSSTFDSQKDEAITKENVKKQLAMRE